MKTSFILSRPGSTNRQREIDSGGVLFPPLPYLRETFSQPHSDFQGNTEQTGFHDGQGSCPPLFPALSWLPVHPFDHRLCLVVLVPHFPLGPDDSLASLICPPPPHPVFLPANWFWMTLQLNILPAHSLSFCKGRRQVGKKVSVPCHSVSSQVRDFPSLLRCRALRKNQIFRSITQ